MSTTSPRASALGFDVPWAEGGERDRAGAAHERELVRVLRHAAAGRDRRRARESGGGQGLRDPVREGEGHSLLDADTARRGAALGERPGDERVRRLVLRPHAHLASPADLL
jgi:hypothetical protein